MISVSEKHIIAGTLIILGLTCFILAYLVLTQ
jgi:hypothetical protein